MTWFYPDVVVAPVNVAFGEVFGSLEVADDIGNKRKGVTVLDSELVELEIVLYKAEFPVFLFNKKYQRSKGRFRRSHVAFSKVIRQESVEFLLFIWGHGINLGAHSFRCSWDKIDSMIPGLVGW